MMMKKWVLCTAVVAPVLCLGQDSLTQPMPLQDGLNTELDWLPLQSK